MAIAVFDYAAWSARFPAMAAVTSEATAAIVFADVGALYIDNTNGSIIRDVDQRTRAMYYAVCHLLALDARAGAGGDAGDASPGRVGSATEGSVTVALVYDVNGDNAAWWSQTTYGATVYQILSPFRLGFYQPGPAPYTGVPRTGQGGFFLGRARLGR